jgi:manganese transport protein
MALLLQSLSARLGIVTQRDLAQASRETYSPFINYILYFLLKWLLLPVISLKY